MIRTAPLVVLLACAAPSEDPTITPDPPVDDDTESAAVLDVCEAHVDRVSPGDGAEGVSLEVVVEVGFTPAPPADRWALTLEGVEGVATLSEDRRTARFVADAPLEPETTYTVAAEACSEVRTASFTTGMTPVDVTDMEGSTWAAQWDEIVWISPAGAGLFASMVGFDVILIEMIDVAADGESFGMIANAGYSAGGVYLPECDNEVVPADVDYSANPAFTTGTTTLSIPIDATSPPTVVRVDDVRFDGTFVDDGDAISWLTGRGLLDTRGIGVLTAPLDPCLVFAFAGAACQACPDGVEACVWAEFQVEHAILAPGSSVSDG